ncbi:MAG: hypothetical protein WC971_00860 [Coriobacteriia bacterium]
MTLQQVLTLTLTAAAIALCGLAVWALAAVARAARAIERLAADTGDRLPPLLDEARATLAALDAGIARVDTIVERVDEVTERMGSATRVAETAVGARIAGFAAFVDRVRRSARSRRG